MNRKTRIYLLLFSILILAAVWRILGISWDNYAFSHPDEQFLRTVSSEIGEERFVLGSVRARCHDEPDGYFNSACSPLNPNNIEEGSFAYGTLPVFLVNRMALVVADVVDDNFWRTATKIQLVGRGLNVIAELIAVFFVFLIGRRLFSPLHGLMTALLYACAALPIQLSHFWTVDVMSHLWFIIAFYFAVVISQSGKTWAYVLFGLALGAAMASRANLIAAAVLAPSAAVIYHAEWLPRIWRLAPGERRRYWLWLALVSSQILLAGLMAFLVFRVAQPYAFEGPGFFDVIDGVDFSPPFIHLNWNEKWREDLKVVTDFASSQTDGWPPSHQFIGRLPYIYPWMNFVWGMGFALWIIGTIGLVVAIVYQWRRRLLSPQLGLLTIWFILYFGWQGQLHFLTLRYYLPLYAIFALLAVWWTERLALRWRRVMRGVLIGGTCLWAFMFTSIYRAPQTRVEAAHWMRDEIPAMVNGRLESGDWTPIVVVRNLDAMASDERSPLQMLTIAQPGDVDVSGELRSSEPLIFDEPFAIQKWWFRWAEPIDNVEISLQLGSTNSNFDENLLEEITVVATDPYYLEVEVPLDDQRKIDPGRYRWELNVNWPGTTRYLHMIAAVEWVGLNTQQRYVQSVQVTSPYAPVPYFYLAPENTTLKLDVREDTTITELYLTHAIGPQSDLMLWLDEETVTYARYVESDGNDDLLGDGRWYRFDEPVTLRRGQTRLGAVEPLMITASTIATEGAWDNAAPHRICWHDDGLTSGYVPYGECWNYGAFDAWWFVELPLHVVEHDDAAKFEYMRDILHKADYLTIATNRMYDALPRNERLFWITTAYYDALFSGDLGYEKVARFESFPRLGPLTIPDQVLPDQNLPDWLNELEAEEAFTVYDHPTIFVYKNVGFERVDMPLYTSYFDERNRIDLETLPTPTYSMNETNPSDGKMWRTIALWGVGWIALGWLAFPLVYVLLKALPVRGYLFGRPIAWLLMSLVPWWLTAATGLPLWRREALAIFAILFLIGNGVLAWRYRDELLPYIRQRWRAMLMLDMLWLVAFGFGILLRGVHPDYWHPWFGGEKPMDLAYLSATIRAETFPPPNPWLSGFSMNYYYLGFVIVGMPLKLLHISIEFGPNLVMATLYATLFTTVVGLITSIVKRGEKAPSRRWLWLSVGAGTLFVMLSGTYGTLHRLINPILNEPVHRWYWYPTRIIGESNNGLGLIINEFPVFSFLYGDVHAHIIGLLPVMMLLAASWTYVQQRSRWLLPVIGALLGVIFMTNVWDVLVYAPLVAGVALLVIFTGRGRERLILLGALGLGGVIIVAPYLPHFTVGHNDGLKRWEGPKTLLEPFLLVWAGPIGVIIIWTLHRLKLLLAPQADAPIEAGLFMLLVTPVLSASDETQVTLLLSLLIVLLAIIAIFQTEVRWIHLAIGFFLIGLLMIDYYAINSDRMNTGFKVSYQLWLWAGLLIPVLLYQMIRLRRAYMPVVLSLLVLAPGLLFSVKAIPARGEDSYTSHFTLDGYAFMQSLQYAAPVPGEDFPVEISLTEDAALVRFMRTNIEGYPVIAEAWYKTYHWNSRIASYTGLPNVIGWRGHLGQQYSHQIPELREREQDMFRFYLSANVADIRQSIRKYNIEYIVSGTFEQAINEGRHVMALEQLVTDGILEVVFEQGSTRLYQVVD